MYCTDIALYKLTKGALLAQSGLESSCWLPTSYTPPDVISNKKCDAKMNFSRAKLRCKLPHYIRLYCKTDFSHIS